MSWGWIIAAVYLAGYASLWRTVVWTTIDDVVSGKPDGVDLSMGILLGSMATIFWPLILAGVLVSRIYAARGETLVEAVQPRGVRRAARRRDLEIQAREQAYRITDLERELGIGRGDRHGSS